MANLHGKGGAVKWDADNANTAIAYVTGWTAEIEHDVVENTSMADATWKTYQGGMTGWTATIEAFADSGGLEIGFSEMGVIDIIGAIELDLFFDLANTLYLHGPCTCTSQTITSEKDGIITLSIDVQGIGSIAYATI